MFDEDLDYCRDFFNQESNIDFPCLPDIITFKMAALILDISVVTIAKVVRAENIPIISNNNEQSIKKSDMIRFFQKKLLCYLPVLSQENSPDKPK